MKASIGSLKVAKFGVSLLLALVVGLAAGVGLAAAGVPPSSLRRILEKLGIWAAAARLDPWVELVDRMDKAKKTANICIVAGKATGVPHIHTARGQSPRRTEQCILSIFQLLLAAA